MHKIDTSSAIPTMPVPSTVGVPGWFSHGSATSAYTILSSDWCNAVQAELMNVIQGAGLTLDKTKQDQLLTALNKMYLARTTITQATIIYVNPTGLDTNDGRTSGAPFKTLQAAINAVYGKYDWNGQTCTIQLANGTYTSSVVGGWAGNFTGNPYGIAFAGLTLQGNTASPSSVIINAVTSNGVVINQGYLNVTGCTFQATGSVATLTQNQGMGLYAQNSWMNVTNCRFANCGYVQLNCANCSIVTMGAGNSFTGTTQSAIQVDVGGQIYMPGQSINVTGLAVTAGSVFQAFNGGLITVPGCTFVGAATGRRYLAAQNGIINTGGGGINALPGSTAGQIITQGQYL